MPMFAVPDNAAVPVNLESTESAESATTTTTIIEETLPTMSTHKPVEGAKRADGVAYRIPPEEIASLLFSPQIARWGGNDNLDLAHVEDLARRIAIEGQLTPAVARPNASGGLEGVEGRHRKAAVQLVNANLPQYNTLRAENTPPLPPIPYPGLSLLVFVKKMTDEEVTAATFSGNTSKPLTVMDLATFAHHNDAFHMPQAQIARLMSTAHHRISPSRVSTLLNLIRLPHKIQTLLHTGEIKESTCQAMLKLGKSAEELLVLADDIAAGRVKPSEIKAQADATRRAKGKKVQRSIADLKYKLKTLPDERLKLTPGELLDWLDGGHDDSIFTDVREDEEENEENKEAGTGSDTGTAPVAYEMVDGKPVRVRLPAGLGAA